VLENFWPQACVPHYIGQLTPMEASSSTPTTTLDFQLAARRAIKVRKSDLHHPDVVHEKQTLPSVPHSTEGKALLKTILPTDLQNWSQISR